MLALGVVASFVSVRLAGRRVTRTRYRPDPWRWPELVVSASGIAVGFTGWWISQHQLTVAYPSLAVAPTVSALALVAIGCGLAGALCAPRPVVPAPAGGAG
jgi:energy-coupling factor transport system permease protein